MTQTAFSHPTECILEEWSCCGQWHRNCSLRLRLCSHSRYFFHFVSSSRQIFPFSTQIFPSSTPPKLEIDLKGEGVLFVSCLLNLNAKQFCVCVCARALRQNFLSKLERNKSGRGPSFDGGTSQEDVQPATAWCRFLSHNKHHLLRFSPMAISFPSFKNNPKQERNWTPALRKDFTLVNVNGRMYI